jgi:hypothetical protein
MDLILLIFLIIAIVSLVAIKKQQKKRDARLNHEKHYNPNKDYLDDVKAATKKCFEEEAEQQSYKNNIKKDYLG